MRWSDIDRSSWERHAADAPLQQVWLWGDVLAGFGARTERLALRGAAGEVAALAQVTTRRVGPIRLSLLSRGPYLPRAGARVAVLRGLGRALEPRPPRVLVVTPERGKPRGLVPLMTPAHIAEIDLVPEPDALRTAMHGKWRNRLRQAEAAGLRLRSSGKPGDWEWLLEKEASQAKSRGYRGWPPEAVRCWHALGGTVHAEVAWRGRTRLAGMLFLIHGEVATYQIGWSGDDGRRCGAHQIFLWRAMTGLRGRGVRRLDLGTVDTDSAPGLARFKIGAGAAVRPLGLTCLVPPRL